MKRFEIPILLLIFNRPEPTKRVLDRVISINPKKIYIVADGQRPNRADDGQKTKDTRELAASIPPDIEVITLFRNENLGCKKSVSDGISWFFSQEEKGIILEDDCLPNLSFFKFCEQLLHHYQDDKRVMHIGGNNFHQGNVFGETNASYHFSHLSHIWGWATWQRAWELYDIEMKDLEKFKQSHSAKDLGWKSFYYRKYLQHFDKVAYQGFNTWDYQWNFAIWNHGGLSIVPNKNLVENIGFGNDATHTVHDVHDLSNIQAEEMAFPLNHPTNIAANSAADNYTLGRFYGANWTERISRKIRSVLAR